MNGARYLRVSPSGKQIWVIDRVDRSGPELNRKLWPERGWVDRAGEFGKARFEVCKGCEESKQEGFGCRLHRGCCFGRWRSRPESRCPIGKWDSHYRSEREQE